MTQADFDALPKAQQEFIQGRIEAGQIKIESPPEPQTQPIEKNQKSPTKPQYRPHVPSAINRYRGKPVKLHLRGGQIISGLLDEIWQYELVVHTDVTKVTVLKHAVCTIEDDSTATVIPEQTEEINDAAETIS